MSFNVFRNSAWSLAQRLRVFRTTASGAPTTDWYLAKKISAWRGPDPGGYWQTVYPDKPAGIVTSNTNGTPVPGFTLSASNYFVWDFSDYRTPDTVTYQWQESLDNITYTDIPGATGTTYTVQDGDIGYYIRLRMRGTNERDFTDVFTSPTIRVPNPYYTFQLDTSEFGVNANAQIFFDKTGGVFPSASHLDFVSGRILKYFFGDYRHYRTWYKSDTSTFRLFHEMYREDQAYPASRGTICYEIVFTNNSNVVDIYVADIVGSSYIIDYTAWEVANYQLKSHPSASYANNVRFRVTMNALTAVSVASAAPSTTAPSTASGWINVDSLTGTSTGTITFSTGAGLFSPISAGVNGAFTKSNMFFPTTPTLGNPAYTGTTTSLVSWTGSNANSYYLTATADGSSVPTYSAYFTPLTTSTTMTGLSRGTKYTVSLSPNSRSDSLGQFGVAATKTYYHGQAPGAVQNLAAGTPSQSVAQGNAFLSWTFSWSAPADNGGFAIDSYEWGVDPDAAGSSGFGTEISTTSTSASIQISTGVQAYIRVRAVTVVGPGPWTQITLNSAPSAPGTPSAGAINATNAVSRVSWTASSDRGSTGVKYTVYRGQNSSNVNTARNNIPTSDLFLDDDISGSGDTYYYKVRPQGSLNTNVTVLGPDSSTSNALSVTQPTVNCLPLISNTAKEVLVLFSAQLGSGNTPTFNLFRGQNTDPVNQVGSTLIGGNTNSGNSLLSITDPSPALNTTYYYKVRLTNSIRPANVPLDSAVSSAIRTPDGTAPNRPGAPTGSANNSNNVVNLSWTASTADEGTTVTYQVFRGQGGSANNPIGSTTNNQYQDNYGNNPPTTGSFNYRVTPSTAWGGTGQQSPVSAPISAS